MSLTCGEPCWDWWKWTWPPDVTESLWWYGNVNDLLRVQNHQPLNSETLTSTNSYRWQTVEFCDIYWLACFVGLTHPFPKDQRTLWRSSFRYFLVLFFFVKFPGLAVCFLPIFFLQLEMNDGAYLVSRHIWKLFIKFHTICWTPTWTLTSSTLNGCF